MKVKKSGIYGFPSKTITIYIKKKTCYNYQNYNWQDKLFTILLNKIKIYKLYKIIFVFFRFRLY